MTAHRPTTQVPPLAARVEELVGRLTRPEKIALLHQHQAPVPRLGIGAFRTGTEALHGLAWLGPATVFPQAVGLAASWDPDLVRQVGAAVGDEVRGFHHKDPDRGGLNVWAPVVNPLRDPRWGRNEEGYAEDPWLTATMATAYARGLRGEHPRFLKTAPTLKHFLGYNNETDRCVSNSSLSPRVLHEYELPAYRAPIATGAAVAVMASYNLVNGRPAHLSPLINDTLRRWTDDELLLVSDAQAPSNLVSEQHYFDSHVDSHAAALRAGIDSFTDNDADTSPTIARLTEAADRGLITDVDLDTAVRRILTIRMRLGEFDEAGTNPYAAIGPDVINCPAHQQLARTAARDSMVLLTNRGLLPLPTAPGRVAVLGPLADVLYADWYSGTMPYTVTAHAGLVERLGGEVTCGEGVDRVALRVAGSDQYLCADQGDSSTIRVTPTPGSSTDLDLFDWGDGTCALRAAGSGQHLRVREPDAVLVHDSPGPNGWVVRETFRFVEQPDGSVAVRNLASDRYLVVTGDGQVTASAASPEEATGFHVELLRRGADHAAELAAAADVAIVVLGNHPMVAGRETEDRTDLALPAAQEALLKAVHAANPRTALVLVSSYPYAIGWAHENLPAVLWSAHGGQEFGRALSDVLLGDADPTGRLTQTWYHSAADLPELLDYDIITSESTYLYYRGNPLYPFGHGLSYTRFGYENLRLDADEVSADGEVMVQVDVVNNGERDGCDVVQLYTRQLRSRVTQPLRALRGFAKVRLAPGQRQRVTLRLPVADLAFWDVTRGRPVVERARHRVMVGRSATDIAASAILTVHGETIPPRRPDGIRAVDYDDCCAIELCDETPLRGDAVRATEAAGWLEFRDVALPAGRARLVLRASRDARGPGTLTLRRDDPHNGTLLATVDVPDTGGRHAFTSVTAQVDSLATAPADLYLVFDEPGTVVAELSWRAEPSR